MPRQRRRPKPAWLQVLVALAGLLFFVALYLALMRLTVDVSRIDEDTTSNYRDTVYFELHLGLLVAATAAGFGLGKWLSGLGAAYAVLFLAVLATAMVFATLGSYALACEGHNDLIRHWTC